MKKRLFSLMLALALCLSLLPAAALADGESGASEGGSAGEPGSGGDYRSDRPVGG